MAVSRGGDSNVELNDTQSNQTSSPMYSHPEESNYMKKLLTIKKKDKERNEIKSTRNGKVPKIGQWGNCCQSMAESRGSDSNVELNDTRVNQMSSLMEN
jgi:hypothetical protein